MAVTRVVMALFLLWSAFRLRRDKAEKPTASRLRPPRLNPIPSPSGEPWLCRGQVDHHPRRRICISPCLSRSVVVFRGLSATEMASSSAVVLVHSQSVLQTPPSYHPCISTHRLGVVIWPGNRSVHSPFRVQEPEPPPPHRALHKRLPLSLALLCTLIFGECGSEAAHTICALL